MRATKKGGAVVWYGFMGAASFPAILRNCWDIFVGARLGGKKGSFYGITALYRRDPEPFKADLPKLFELLARGR